MVDFAQFQKNYQALGHVAGFEKGSTLPDAGTFQRIDNLGTVTLKYVSDTGATLRADETHEGTVGTSYTFTAPEISGYRLVSQASVTGTFAKEGAQHTFTYAQLADKSALSQAIHQAQSYQSSDYTQDSWKAFASALAQAQQIEADAAATQAQVTQALEQLNAAMQALVKADAAQTPPPSQAPSQVPQTGDENNLIPWVAAGSLSLAGAAYLLGRRKHKS